MILQNYKQKYIPFLLILFFTLLAWFARFIQDDAFISFRYAKNFAAGLGLVFNSGDRVEGYSNFLWTLILSIPHILKTDAVIFSQITGIILFAFSLLLVYNLAAKLTGNFVFSILVLFFTGSNFTFISYATGGLETQLFTFLILFSISTIFNTEETTSYKKYLLLSFLLSALLLTRPDSVPYIGIILIYLFHKMRKDGRIVIKSLMVLLPLIICAAIFLSWKYYFYGDILPNTYYAKVSGSHSARYGLYYIFTFLKSYLLIIFPFILALLLNKKDFTPEVAALFSFLVFIIVYVIYIGGDFMEFRFFVPVIPIFFILVVLSFKKIKAKWVIVILSLLIVTGSISHAFNFRSDSGHKLYSIRELNGQVYNNSFSWMEVGKQLNKYFKPGDVTLATTAAGAIPYFSNLRTIDMHGLNDRYIARYGITLSKRPGHNKIAPLEYLISQKVNLLIGHPFVMWKAFDIDNITTKQFKIYFMYDASEMPAGSEVIKMPLNNGYCIFLVYLKKNKTIDEVIKHEGWETERIELIFNKFD